MAHTIKNKAHLLHRVRRLKGQVEAIERALDQEADCGTVFQQISACRGAIGGLMSEIIEGHIRMHIVPAGTPDDSEQAAAAQQLIDVLKTYLK